MRSITLFAVAGLAALSLAACSDEHATQIKEGAKAAGSEIKQAATDIKNDPDVKQAGTALKESTEEAAADAKVAAGKAVDKAQELGGQAARRAFLTLLIARSRFRRDRWSMNSTPFKWSISCWMQTANRSCASSSTASPW